MTFARLLFDRLPQRSAILVLSLVATSFGLASPYFQKHFVDTLMSPTFSSAQYGDVIRMLFLAFISIWLTQIFGILAGQQGIREGIVTQDDLSQKLYTKMLALRSDSLEGRTTGEITGIYSIDVPGATAMIEMTVPMAMSSVLPIVLAPFAIHAYFDIPILPTVGVIVGIATVIGALSLRQARFFSKFKALAALRTGIASEWIQNIRTLRILGWVDAFEKRIYNVRAEETENRIAMVTNGQTMGSIATSIPFLVNLSGVATLVSLKPGTVTPGDLLAMLWILGIFLARPFRQLPWLFTFTMDSTTSIRRLEDFLSLENHVSPTPPATSAVAAPRSDAALSVRNLNLTIGGSPYLRAIDLDVKSGEFLAIVGEVGSGKTLLLLSLMGETGATMSSYLLQGQEALAMSSNRLRQHFSFVPQEGFVMSSSLRDNVAFEYGTPESFDLRIEESLQDAQFRFDRENISTGLNTEIGERGVNLSGGQRQRVGIARARFFDRPLFLLDDCLSAVDVDTERKLLDSLFSGAWKARTRILVTHRLTVLPKTDRILFLKDGRISDQGTFDELMKRSAEFREFAATVAEREAAAKPGELS